MRLPPSSLARKGLLMFLAAVGGNPSDFFRSVMPAAQEWARAPPS